MKNKEMWIKIAFAIFLANVNGKTIRKDTDLNKANKTDNIEDIKNVANDTDTIKVLENKRNYLLKQINKAINESIYVLQKTNDSEGIAGMEYLKQLKEHLKNMFDFSLETNLTNEINETILRRSDIAVLGHHKQKKHKKSQEKYEKWLADMTEMREKIDIWMKERNQQKEKRKRERWEKTRQRLYEKCPKEGFEDTQKGGRMKYPCCRDCCKRSYMGCR